MKNNKSAANCFRRFGRQENGTVTVESVIWFPIYLLILGLIFDATMLMMGKTEMWSIANDTSRLVALGRMTESEAEDYVNNTLSGNRGLVADVTTSGDIVSTVITRPFGTVGSLGIINSSTAELTTQSFYRIEPTS